MAIVGRALIAAVVASALIAAGAQAAGKPSRIVYAAFADQAGYYGSHLFTVRPNGTRRRQLTRGAEHAVAPSWSPNRRRIVFVEKDEHGSGVLYTVHADGTHLRRIPGTEGARNPSWSPRGRRIAFALDRATTSDPYDAAIFSVHPDGNGLKRLTRWGPYGDPDWSPRARWIVYSSSSGIFSMRADGSRRRLVVAPGYGPSWSPRGIAYTTGTDVETVRLDGTHRRNLTRSRPRRDCDEIECRTRRDLAPAWSPSGKRIVFAEYQQGEDGGPQGLVTVTSSGKRFRQIVSGGEDPDW